MKYKLTNSKNGINRTWETTIKFDLNNLNVKEAILRSCSGVYNIPFDRVEEINDNEILTKKEKLITPTTKKTNRVYKNY